MPNTISGATWDLDIKFPEKVYKPDRGVFRLTKFKEDVAIPHLWRKHTRQPAKT
jgi:hypothetical protein